MKKKNNRLMKIAIGMSILAVCTVLLAAGLFMAKRMEEEHATPQEVLNAYFALIPEKKYEEMYGFLSAAAKENISKEAFMERNQNIYDGIECSEIKIEISEEDSVVEEGAKEAELVYKTTMQTLAGEALFGNSAVLTLDEEKEYKIEWTSRMIFPDLGEKEKVKIRTKEARRGSILDRNGKILAQNGAVSEVGLVPGKMPEDPTQMLSKLASLLDTEAEKINKELSASWVTDETFVPLKRISRENEELEKKLLACEGVLIQNVEDRVYPYGEMAGHITGYIQSISEEQLKELEAEGYHSGSKIGKAGAEKMFEEALRPKEGYEIYIADESGVQVNSIAAKEAQDGEDVTLTIDIALQKEFYEAFKDTSGANGAMDPSSGELLALLSTPCYDPNEFIWGLSQTRWDELNNDPKMPLTNKYLASWVPGSTFKPITAMIGIDSGKLDPLENKGNVGKAWQKDGSWGSYKVTTLTDYGSEVNLKNALIYSDNIYFARTALEIGADTFEQALAKIGFGEECDFTLPIQNSTFAAEGKITSEIQLADTGYGQGQLLVNPIFFASIYSAFTNDGNMVRPVLLLDEEKGAVYKQQAFSSQAVKTVKDALYAVIETPDGTGHAAWSNGVRLYGKTGTAETKASQGDAGATEYGWLACAIEEGVERPLEIISMVQDIQNEERGFINKNIKKIVQFYIQQR